MSVSFEIKSSSLPTHATVAAFRGSEGISRPYVFDVYVNVIGAEEVEVDDAPGSRATLIIHDPSGTPIRFDGMIATFELIRSVQVGTGFDKLNTLYLVRIVPNLWQLSLTKHSRIWTKKTIPEIIQEVLEEEGVHRVDMRLHGSYEAEEHVCQYKESSLNFIHRWMEREGMYYFFEQGDAGETLVVTDSKAASTLSRLLPIPYHTGGEGHSGAGAHIDTFSWRHSAMPAAVTFTDYDYTKPALDVQGKASVSSLGVGEVVTYGNRFFNSKQGNALAAVRADDLRAQAKTFHGSGPVLGVTSGHLFMVEGHPKLQMNAEYLAVSVEHFGFMHTSASSWGKAIPHEYTDTYRVDFHAISSTQQYRHPELAAWPRLDGFENAIVDGPATSDYAQIDGHGRYNVKFKFDEGTLKGGKASTWVRKMQPHAGTVEGWHFPERSGTEVICAFLGGDPDRPIIIGAIPTAIHPSPVTAANHTQNVIQTGGLNRFEMEDLAGQQRVTMSTPHAQTHILMGNPRDGHEFIAKTQGNSLHHTDLNHDTIVGANHSEQVGATLTQTVTGATTHTWNSSHTLTVAGPTNHTHNTSFTSITNGPHEHTTNGPFTQTTDGDHTHTTTGDHTATTEGDHTQEIGGEEKYKTAGDVLRHIGGSWHNIVDGFTNWEFEGAKNETVCGMVNNKFLGVKLEFTGGLSMETTIGAKIELMAAIKLEATASVSIELAPECINIEPEKLQVSASKNEAELMKNTLSSLKSTMAAINLYTNGVTQKTTGLDRRQAALSSKISGLISNIGALHSHL